MATDIIKLDYGLAEDMINTFKQGAEQLQDTMQEMQSLANTLEEGALLGQGGDAFVDAIRGKLCPAIAKLTDKYNELADDVAQAVRYMQEADRASQSQFK